MNYKLHHVLVVLLFTCAVGCKNKQEPYAFIDDIAQGAASGYLIIEVDGSAPVRRESTQLLCLVPYVMVSPGSHELLLIKNTDGIEEKIEVHVKKGNVYFLCSERGFPELIKRVDE